MKIKPFDQIPLLEIGNTYQIAGTIWANASESFVTLFPEKVVDALEDLYFTPMTLENWETFLRQTDLLETEIFGVDKTGKLVKAIVRKTQRSIDSFMQWRVFKRDNYTCRYCGRTGIPLTVDHIDLWENGGATIEDNLLSACKSCNKDRGRMEYEDWLSSPLYQKRATALLPETRVLNEDVLKILPALRSKRVKNIRSR